MYTKIILEDFIDSFKKSERGNQFSREALKLIYENLEEMQEECGFDDKVVIFGIDYIGICCVYTEYSNLEAYNCENDTNFEKIEDIDCYFLTNGTTLVTIE